MISRTHPTQISLYLHNILLVPSIAKNLLSVNKFAIDNGVYFEFYPHNYIIKSKATNEILLRPPNTEIDYHFVKENELSREITTNFVNSSDQLADLFTKTLRVPQIDYICNKLVPMTYGLQLEQECQNVISH